MVDSIKNEEFMAPYIEELYELGLLISNEI